MLFVSLLRTSAGTPQETAARRLKWQYPQGVRVVAEYWLQTNDPAVIAVLEADSVAPLVALNVEWGDVFDITTVPAITAEEGLGLLRQMMQS
jgi:hypothetical protein